MQHLLSLESSLYADFCQHIEYAPLYCEPWWLQAAVGESSSLKVLCSDIPEKANMMLPLFEPVVGYIEIPPFCQFLGPLSRIPALPYDRKNYARRWDAQTSLSRQLSEARVWSVHTFPETWDWIPYREGGATATPFFTHHLSLCSDVEKMRSGYNTLIRRKIKTFEKGFSSAVVRSCTEEQLISLVRRSFERKGRKVYFVQSLRRLVRAAIARNVGWTWGVFESESSDSPLAVAFVVRHRDTAYYIAGGHTETSKGGENASAYLMDVFIQHCASQPDLCRLDLEGSMEPGIAFFFRSLGAEPIPYLRINQGHLSLSQRWFRHRFYKKYID